MPAVNHYDALEVSPNASPEVIRAAYKSLIQRFHPDKNPGDEAVAARAAAIVQAYRILSDAGERAEYNLSLQCAALQGALVDQAAWPGAGFDRARDPPRDRLRIGFWLLLLLIAAGVIWAVVSITGKKIEPRAELVSIRHGFASTTATEAQKRQLYARKLALLEQHPDLLRSASADRSEDMAARSFALLENPLVVRVGSETPDAPGPVAELTVQGISLLVGSFDSQDLLAHIARHRERLIQELAARLAKENPDRFARPDGEAHLKRVVLDSVSASLGTDPDQEYPSTYFESPGRHGVVDALLPEHFRLVQLSSLRR